MIVAVVPRSPASPSRMVVDLRIDGGPLIGQGIVLLPGHELTVIAMSHSAVVSIGQAAPATAPILSAAPPTAPVRMDAFGAVVISDVSRDSVRTLLYDLGLRGLTDKQRATVEAWLEKAAK